MHGGMQELLAQCAAERNTATASIVRTNTTISDNINIAAGIDNISKVTSISNISSSTILCQDTRNDSATGHDFINDSHVNDDSTTSDDDMADDALGHMLLTQNILSKNIEFIIKLKAENMDMNENKADNVEIKEKHGAGDKAECISKDIWCQNSEITRAEDMETSEELVMHIT